MKWKQTQLRNSDTRIRSGFLFFPRLCNGQWRWWERAVWEQKFVVCYDMSWWDNVRWIDPVVPVDGQIYVSDCPPENTTRIWYDPSQEAFKVWTGCEWVAVKK